MHTWIRSHVRACLMDIWKSCQIASDDDGDFPFRFKSAACYVQVEKDRPISSASSPSQPQKYPGLRRS